nr:retrovirus-related Pol polyprotein from transposon TNT 1-94 [Tanacetum cinerariifolium]
MENEKLPVDSVLNRPFKYGIVIVLGTQTTPATVRETTYDELTDAEKIREGCDIKATNIVFQGLPQDIYNLERESKLYDEFDMFTSVPKETIHTYYLSKFTINVKLAKDLHNTNLDHLYGYLRQHEAHAEEVPLTRQRYSNPIALFDSRLVVPSFLPSDNHIASLNKAMALICAAFASKYPPTNNQLRTSSNPRNQATIQDGIVTVQTVQRRQTQGYASTGVRSNATGSFFNKNGGTSTAEKAMFAEALELGVALDKEQMAFLADNRDTVTTCQASQELVTTVAFQTDDLDAFDSDCDEVPSANAVLMAKLSAYDSNVLLEVPTHDNYLDAHVNDQIVQKMQYYEQTHFNNETYVDKITILSGADNRPPMLEKDMYDSWKSRMELYMMNRQHERMILESVENGPLLRPTVEENRVTIPKKYSELSATKAIQADCDVKATNIILQGLSPEVYALVSNHKVIKEL